MEIYTYIQSKSIYQTPVRDDAVYNIMIRVTRPVEVPLLEFILMSQY